MHQLADILGYTPATLKTNLWRMRRGDIPPTRLPWPLATGGGRPVWTEEAVEAWKKACTATEIEDIRLPKKDAPRKPGRPRGSRKTAPKQISLY